MKVSQQTRIMRKIRNHIPLSLAKHLYKTLIHPLYTYCDFIYDGCSRGNKIKLQISQNAALWAVNKSPLEYAIVKFHDELEIDYLETTHRKSTLKMVYRGLTNSGPASLNQIFEIHIPGRTLKSENESLILPPFTHKIRWKRHQMGFEYWNPLPTQAKTIATLNEFKSDLKPYGTQLC